MERASAFAKRRRIYLDKLPELRTQLLEFCGGRCKIVDNLVTGIRCKTKTRWLADLVQVASKWPRPLRRSSPGVFNLLRSLAMTSPMSSYLPYAAAKALLDVQEGAEDWGTASVSVSNYAPLFDYALTGTVNVCGAKVLVCMTLWAQIRSCSTSPAQLRPLLVWRVRSPSPFDSCASGPVRSQNRWSRLLGTIRRTTIVALAPSSLGALAMRDRVCCVQ